MDNYEKIVREKLKNGESKKDILKYLKEELSYYKKEYKKWHKEALKELDKFPSYESPRIYNPGYKDIIVSLEKATAVLIDFDISKSILPNRGEIQYAMDKDMTNIVCFKDILSTNGRFDYAFNYLAAKLDLTFSERDLLRGDIKKAVILNQREEIKKLINKFIKDKQAITKGRVETDIEER